MLTLLTQLVHAFDNCGMMGISNVTMVTKPPSSKAIFVSFFVCVRHHERGIKGRVNETELFV